MAAGREQLDKREFRFAIDVAYLQDVLKIGEAIETPEKHEEDVLLRTNFSQLLDDPDYAVFAGRDDAFQVIETFLAGPSAVLAVTAPAGLGKTALLAELVRRQPSDSVYHFFNARYENGEWLDEVFFLRSMIQQFDPGGGSRAKMDLASLRAIYRRFLLRSGSVASFQSAKPKTIILDGLDEVRGWSPATYISGRLADDTHVIVSIRDTGQDWHEDYQLRRTTVTELPLQGFDGTAVAAVFEATGDLSSDLIRQPGAVSTIMDRAAYVQDGVDRRSGSSFPSADPLYVRFLAEDANTPGVTLQDLTSKPRGLSSYLDRWWLELCNVAGDQVPIKLFAVLTVSFGPLTRDDLAAAVPEHVNDPLGYTTDWFERKLLPRIRRVVSGNNSIGYSLTHPRLRQHFLEKFTPTLLNEARQDLLNYCSAWSESESRYGVTNYPFHLAELDPGSLPALCEDFGYLERAIRTLGVDRVAGNLRKICALPEIKGAVEDSSRKIVHLLDLEAHHLRPPFFVDDDGYCARQLGMQALINSDLDLGGRAQNFLASISDSTLVPIWSAGAASPALKRTFEGHTHRISSVCMTPDGSRAVSGAWDNEVRVWDLEEGVPLLTLDGHTDHVLCVAVSMDGTTAISGGRDKTAILWDLRTRQVVSVLQGHSQAVTAVAISASGDTAFTASWDGTARIWPIISGQASKVLEGHRGPITAFAVSPQGDFVVTGGLDATVRIWDADSGVQRPQLVGHVGSIHSIAIEPGGKRILTGADDATALLWSVETGKVLSTLKGHSLGIKATSFYSDGLHALTGSDDQTAKLWDLTTGDVIQTFRGHSGHVNGVLPVLHDSAALTASWDGTIRVWNTDTGSVIQVLDAHNNAVTAVASNREGTQCVTASIDRKIRHWDVPATALTRRLRGHSDRVLSAALSGSNETLVTTSSDGTVIVWDLANGEELHRLSAHSGRVTGLSVSPDGSRGLTTDAQGTVMYWDLSAGRLLLTLRGQRFNSSILSPEADRAMTVGTDGAATLWDLRDGHKIHTLRAHSNSALSVAITPDGQRAVTTGSDSTACHWDLTNGEMLHILRGHTGRVVSVVITPDGTRALTASNDGSVRQWNLITGKSMHTLRGLTDGKTSLIGSVSLDKSGTRALTGGKDGVARLWDLRTGTLLRELSGHNRPLTSVVISDDGMHAMTTGWDSTARIWNLDSFDQEQQVALGSVATCGVWSTIGGSTTAVLGEESGTVTVFRGTPRTPA
ncbi:WD40 repeat domain-containing protein [Arthrobacter sp. B1I2]|uniref:WD40 repeat domain-containing protein n=1 Tax=Arthrobacter sp. B1I2 TaxID=3042263 RepID=UPI0027D82903|nr:WD40 repeat domain-containing protein [Arthrobacter sp. B1I2]